MMQAKSINDLQNENLGDCEIDLISFRDNTVRLNIVDPYQHRILYVDFIDVGLFLFETNHMQNVIQGILIHEDYIRAAGNSRIMNFISERNIHKDVFANKKIAYIVPISGAEAIITFSDIEYFETKNT